jgi:8-hydroxy-5-deazaflavin:NADPH oxidoreductase
MKVGIVGSGGVAQALGRGFAERGDEVKLGSRSPEKLAEWVAEVGGEASAGTMAEAAEHGELLVLACKGTETESAIEAAGTGNLAGKVLIDVTNPLIQGDGIPTLAYGPTDSGGEVVQRAAPEAKVVKTLNIVNSGQMVHPEVPDGPATMFVAGEDEGAKRTVTGILGDFGWSDVVDLGGIEAARELESLCVLWCRVAIPTQQWQAAFRLLR